MMVTVCDWKPCGKHIDGLTFCSAQLWIYDADGDQRRFALDGCTPQHLDFAIENIIHEVAPGAEGETHAAE